ncbi:DUF3309 domain-containing protein [Methylobacterium sp.]|uniref:DUF3309 domain-containing protein n=1 Tax=Methylobacterium sp. TaxID=409 RepID=UPI003AFFB4AB
MSLLSIFLIALLVLAVCGGFLGGRTYGGYGYGIGGMIAIVLVVLAFTGRL